MMAKAPKVSEQIEAWVHSESESTQIKTDGLELTLEESLRHLPKKRLTCRANWQGSIVIAKFFYGNGFAKYARKEQEVLNALLEAGINTPALLKVYQQGDFTVLIIDYIAEAISLLSWLENKPTECQFQSVISETTTLMLACHKAGFDIKDQHLGNFLLRKNQVFIIDAGDIKQLSSSLNNKRSINNIALLYAQFPVTKDDVAYQILVNLLTNLNQSILLDEKRWQQLLLKQRRWRQKRFIDKKVFRECTAYICKSNSSRFLVAKRDGYTKELEIALSNPDALIENGLLLKDGKTATVALVEISDQTYVLKRYNIKKPIHSIIRGLKWSRAAVSWRNGLLLEMLGIPTATSYALIEERWGPLRRRSYLLSEYIDAPQAWEVFEGECFTEQEKMTWAKNLYNLFVLLKRSQISHGDLKAQNILCPSSGALFIDLDGMKANQSLQRFTRQFKKDIKRFLLSWPLKIKDAPYFFKKILLLLDDN